VTDSDLAIHDRLSSDSRSEGGCPACGAGQVSSACLVPDHEYGLDRLTQYAQCDACHSVYQDPMPGVQQLAAFYPRSYHSMSGGGGLAGIRHDMRARRLRPMARATGAVLDYGCGDGSFLLRAAERMPGKQFYGFEIANVRR
jgi:hypothetical protein